MVHSWVLRQQVYTRCTLTVTPTTSLGGLLPGHWMSPWVDITGPRPCLTWIGNELHCFFSFHSQDWGLQTCLWKHGWACLPPGLWLGWTAPWLWPGAEYRGPFRICRGTDRNVSCWVPVPSGLLTEYDCEGPRDRTLSESTVWLNLVGSPSVPPLPQLRGAGASSWATLVSTALTETCYQIHV